MSPVNYAGTQTNVWDVPGGDGTDEFAVDPNRNPEYRYMREQMFEVNFPFGRNMLV